MMIWCAYCQQFQGEAPPYDKFLVSHGICPDCRERGLDLSKEQIDQAHSFRILQEKLRSAGQQYDLPLARQLIADAIGVGVRPVDILLGLVTPLLYELGQEWELGMVTVAEEHRFTTFFEHVLAHISTLIHVKLENENEKPTVLLVNAKGNNHTLGLQMFQLSLYSHGVRSEIVCSPLVPRQVFEKIKIRQPKVVGISVALAEHVPWLREVAEVVMTLEEKCRPLLIVGGFAVHEGKVPTIKEVRLFTEFDSFNSMVRECIQI